MSLKHLNHICNALNVGVTDPAARTTPANVTYRWHINAANVLALEDHWQFVPDSAYDPTGVPPAKSENTVVITGNNGQAQFYFLLTRTPS